MSDFINLFAGVDEQILMCASDVLKNDVDRLCIALGIFDMKKFVPAVSLFVYSVFVDEIPHIGGAI